MDYQVMPPLSADEFYELKADIKARGVQVPIEYDESGNVLDGHHRIMAVEQLLAEGAEVPPPPRIIRKGLSEPEKRAHARTLNLARRHLDQAQKRAAIAAQIKDTPERSDRQIAAALGVSHHTVAAQREDLEGIGQIAQCSRQTSDGRTYPAERAKPKSVHLSTEAVEKAEALPEKQRNAVLSGELPLSNHRAIGTGENEWYTPVKYLELAREVLVEIDLDPASSAIANEMICAKRFHTIADNGLSVPWAGRVWMNPPYAQPTIAHFCEKLASEWESGNLESAIALTHNYTDTAWCQRLANACSAVCFTRGRIAFESPSGEKAAPTQGQAFFYFGDDIVLFRRVFSVIGVVLCRL